MSLRVLTVSKPYVAEAYRDKIRLLNKDTRLKVGLVCPPRWATQDFEQISSEPPDYPIYQIPISLNGHHHFHFYSPQKINQVLDEFKPDILNIEEEHYSLVTYEWMKLGKRRGIRSLFYTWQNINKNYPPPFSWMEKDVFKNCPGAVAGNEEARLILERKGYRGKILCLPQMGVNETLFPIQNLSEAEKKRRQRDLGLDENIFWIIYCGRLVPEKGIHHIFKAQSLLGPLSSKVGVLVLGDGPERQALAASFGQGPLPAKFVRSVPSHAVPQWLAAADALCLPSLTQKNWKEQFGRVLVEAMACSTVVVGSNSGEIPQVIGDAGLIFPEGDTAALAQCLRRLAEAPDFRRQLQELGRNRVKTFYTNRVIAEKLADFLVSLG